MFFNPLMKITPQKLFFLFFFLFLFCHKKEEPTQFNLDPKYETPRSSIETYWTALFENRYKDALMCFVDFQEEDFDIKELFPIPDWDSLWIDSIIYLKIDKNHAEIHYIVAFTLKDDEQERAVLTGDKLKLTKEGWKISDVIIPW